MTGFAPGGAGRAVPNRTQRFARAPYVVAAGAVVAATLARAALDPLLADRLPYPSYFLAVTVAAWIGGLKPALLATGLGFLAVDFFFLEPRGSLRLLDLVDRAGVGLYLAVCVTVGGFGEAMHRARRRAQQHAEALRTTLASIGDGVLTTDAQGLVTGLNVVAEALTGWTAADASGQPLEVVFRIVNEETREAVDNPARRALREGVVVGLANHTVLLSRDGGERPIDDSAAPIRGPDGELAGCVLVFRDVAERRASDLALRASEAAARRRLAEIEAIYDTAPVGLALVDRDLRFVRINERLAAMNGLPAAEHLGRSIREVVPEVANQVETGFGRVVSTGEPVHEVEVTARTPADPAVPHTWLASGHPLRGGAGEVLGVHVVAVDITERKRGEDRLREQLEATRAATTALRASEARYRAIGEAIDFGVWMCDANGNNTYASDSFLRLTGLTQEACSGDGWGRALAPEDVEPTITAWRECVRTGGVWDREHRFRGTDGEWHHVLARGVPVRDDSGAVLGWVGINLDIDRLKHAEEALTRANQAKDEFLATLAHELRNPLAPVRTAASVLAARAAERTDLAEPLAILARQTERMARLIDDLLDVSRITRNRLELRKAPIALAAVVEEAVEASRAFLETDGHQLTVDLPTEPIPLVADAARLAQVLVNLLSNASKYTDRGGRIRLAAERQHGEAVVRVTDDGIGIPAEHLPGLFTMFSQVGSALERSKGGLGIGLALAKRLVSFHGGTIQATSDGPGHGSTFVVRLPLATAVAAPAVDAVRAATEPAGAPSSSVLRILVVDDNHDAAASLAMLLDLSGHRVRTAADGEEAVRAAAEFEPHVILLDIGLPKLNGYEACRRIRATPGGRDVFILAVTGWGQDGDRRRAAEAGFDHHLVKPVDPGALLELLAAPERWPHARARRM